MESPAGSAAPLTMILAKADEFESRTPLIFLIIQGGRLEMPPTVEIHQNLASTYFQNFIIFPIPFIIGHLIMIAGTRCSQHSNPDGAADRKAYSSQLSQFFRRTRSHCQHFRFFRSNQSPMNPNMKPFLYQSARKALNSLKKLEYNISRSLS